MTEQQIQEEILRYLNDESYNYAVLIDGEWGSGKTYFVNNSLTKKITEREATLEKPRSVKYISLYGCKNILDVQENIAWSFAENARKKIEDKENWGATGEKISSNVLISSKKIGNAILKKFLPETSLYQITSDWLNLGSFIFLFDDLERCDCPLNEIFGFLNELVEHEKTKVIIIANEKELSSIAETQQLELQYYLTLDNRIQWPQKDGQRYYTENSDNSKKISLDEMDRRRKMLFPTKEIECDYRRIREKLIGVTLKYEPDISLIIEEIIDNSNYEESIKTELKNNKQSFESTMKYYHHRNLRTFQFFLSKVRYLLGELLKIDIDEEYFHDICDHIICETFSHAVKFKANYQPPRDNYAWFKEEQSINFQSIKQYIEFGNYEYSNYERDVLKFQKELQAKISGNDPYFLLYQRYYLHKQAWCEEQLAKILKNIEDNKYPLSYYGKIIVIIQRLLDLGFDEKYMNCAKKFMVTNISKMGVVGEIDFNIIYFENKDFKEKVTTIINEINYAIRNHANIVSRENVSDILKDDDWINKLDNYINPTNNHCTQDISVFSKAPSELWVKALNKASPEEIDDFRECLISLYPNNTTRKSYLEDANTIKSIIEGLKGLEEKDLIKKACIKWLTNQMENIVEWHEPTKDVE